MQFLSINYSKAIWKSCGSWLRTMRYDIPPSEKIVSLALQNTFGVFLADGSKHPIFKKFLGEKIDFARVRFNNLEDLKAA